MKKKYDIGDLTKEWPKVRQQLLKVGQDAVELAKKGEAELIRFSQKSKLHMDATALSIKQEHLYHLVGKEYIRAKCPAKPGVKLKKYVDELQQLEKDAKAIKRQIRQEKNSSQKGQKTKQPKRKSQKKS